MTTTIRPATKADLPVLVPIWLEMMRTHEQVDARFGLAPDAVQRWLTLAEELLARQDGFLFVGWVASEPAGFCLGWLAKNPPVYRVQNIGFISELAVAPAERRRGIGQGLVKRAERWFQVRGVSEFQLSTAVWNHNAQLFWEKIGGQALLLRYRFTVDTE